MKYYAALVASGLIEYLQDTDWADSEKAGGRAVGYIFGSAEDGDVFLGDKVLFTGTGTVSDPYVVTGVERADHGEHILAVSTGRGEHYDRADGLASACHAADGHAGGPAAKAQAQADFNAHMKRSGWSVLAVSLSAVMKTVAGTDNRDALRASNDNLARAAAKAFFADEGRTYVQLREFAADLLNMSGSDFIFSDNRQPNEVGVMVVIQRRLDALKRGWASLGVTPKASARLRILTAAGEVDSGYDEVAVAANAEHLVMLSPLVNGKFVELRPGNDRLTTFAYSDSGDPEIVEATTLPSGESVEFAYETSTTFDPATATWSAEAPLFSANARRIIVRLAAQEDAE